MARVHDCDSRLVPPKIKVFYAVFLGMEGLGKRNKKVNMDNRISNLYKEYGKRSQELKRTMYFAAKPADSSTPNAGAKITDKLKYLKGILEDHELHQFQNGVEADMWKTQADEHRQELRTGIEELKPLVAKLPQEIREAYLEEVNILEVACNRNVQVPVNQDQNQNQDQM